MQETTTTCIDCAVVQSELGENHQCEQCATKAWLVIDLERLVVCLNNAHTPVQVAIDKNTLQSRKEIRKVQKRINELFDVLCDTLSYVDAIDQVHEDDLGDVCPGDGMTCGHK